MWPRHDQTDCVPQLLPQTTNSIARHPVLEMHQRHLGHGVLSSETVSGKGVVMVSGIGDDHGEGFERRGL